MTLTLTPEQFQQLVYLTVAGEYALTGHIEGGDEQYQPTLQLILKKAKEEGLGHWVSKFDDGYIEPSQELMLGLTHTVHEFAESLFWDLLAEGLATRDLAKIYSDARWEALGSDEQYRLMGKEIDRYEEEFVEHGLERLEISR